MRQSTRSSSMIRSLPFSTADFNMPVVLNVGGTRFETSLETLKKNPGPRDRSMLANLNYVEGEEMFIDRDPAHFVVILNYLRDGSVSIDEDECTLAEIKREAQFYGLEDLVQHIEGLISRALLASVPFDFLRNLTPGDAFAIRRNYP
ncbi:unnamed protein product [Cylicostephanus goldi]|uniref:BTB domain-containing protein n=1 Tax=Cylicostephanus goldi TaxID=71465 RepID=A0A3P6SU29_CYLGO|nr:unnamed protein product [Cylicostephanus goldi]